MQTMEVIMEQNRYPGDQMARFQIEPDMMPAIGKYGMVTTFGVGGDRQPACQHCGIETIGGVGRSVHGDNAQCARVEIGMPDDPRVRGRKLRMFVESGSPITPDRR